ncbi:MAG: DNA repair protein RecN [Pseudomonadota bacterium]
MLSSLSIQDIVLIDRLDFHCGPGLSVLTGETGAGKSILLDALGLALGSRADSALIRQGANQGSVTARFDLPTDHEVARLLGDQGIAFDGELLLRRVISADGRNRAFINDQPVSATLLRQIGEQLVEIHGQHDDRGLVNPAGHRALLDAFGGHQALLDAAATRYEAWQEALAALDAAQARQKEAEREEDYLRHAGQELARLDPRPGEEAALAQERALMLKGQAVAEGLSEVAATLSADGGIDAVLRGALRRLERLAEKAEGVLEEPLAALDRAAEETAEAVHQLDAAMERLSFDPQRLETVEVRLFDIRAQARKHGCLPDELAALREDLAARLAAIDTGAERMAALAQQAEKARRAFHGAVAALTAAREEAARRLDAAVNRELAPLKLDKAKFRTRLAPLGEESWSASGGERVAFEVATNPGAPFGPLIKIASGGELARFILALKVALAAQGPASAMIFDEVDRGVGGATASAVGERLARLAQGGQVIVVTHSPQVAARAGVHWRIEKTHGRGHSLTRITRLDDKARREELARMLSGARVTEEARAAAASLLTGAT